MNRNTCTEMEDDKKNNILQKKLSFNRFTIKDFNFHKLQYFIMLTLSQLTYSHCIYKNRQIKISNFIMQMKYTIKLLLFLISDNIKRFLRHVGLVKQNQKNTLQNLGTKKSLLPVKTWTLIWKTSQLLRITCKKFCCLFYNVFSEYIFLIIQRMYIARVISRHFYVNDII